MNKNQFKQLALTAAVAIVCSGATVFSIGRLSAATGLPGASLFTMNSNSEGTPAEQAAGQNKFYRTAAAAAPANTDFTKAAESTVNGVVSIKSFATPRMQYGNQGGFNPFGDDLFDFFFGTPRRQQPQPQPRQRGGDSDDESAQRQLGLGSGVIISDDGYIVTNNHVIDGAERLEVTLNDNRTFNATVVGSDPNTDLALVKIDAKELPVIPMGDSDKLKVGEWVLAVGNPFGFTSTVTSGIVSAKARSISQVTHSRNMGIESYIQTDAAVNPGNSGGALVNLAGELVGINTAIYSNTGSYSGYSFAIPTSIVKKVVSDIRQYGAVQRAVLGITISELNSKIAKEKGITAVNEGAVIEEVSDLSAAREAGLKKGDVIIALGGQPVKTIAQLHEQVARYRPGDKVKVTYVRDNKTSEAMLTLRNSQGNTKVTQPGNVTELGCAFRAASEETCRSLGIRAGLEVIGLKDGLFKDAGIKDGFIILDINNSRVTDADDVEKLYNAIVKSDSDPVMFITGIYPTGQKRYYAVPLSKD